MTDPHVSPASPLRRIQPGREGRDARGGIPSSELCETAIRAYDRLFRTAGGDPDFATNIDYAISRPRLERRRAATDWVVPPSKATRILSVVETVEAAPEPVLETWFEVFTDMVLGELERRSRAPTAAGDPSAAAPRRRAGDRASGSVAGRA